MKRRRLFQYICLSLLHSFVPWPSSALEVLEVTPGDNSDLFLHVHIPKTGGSSLSNQLASTFAPLVTKCSVGGKEWGRDFADVLTAARDSGLAPAGPNRTCNFLSYEGGLSWMVAALEDFGLPRGNVRPLLLLRQPLERRLSGILHARRLDGDDAAGTHTPHSYGQQASPSAGLSGEYGNGMAQQLVCPAPQLPPGATWGTHPHNYWYRPCRYTTDQLQAAVASAFWLGLTEYYRPSLCVLAFQLSAFDPAACACGATGATKKNAMKAGEMAETTGTGPPSKQGKAAQCLADSPESELEERAGGGDCALEGEGGDEGGADGVDGDGNVGGERAMGRRRRVQTGLLADGFADNVSPEAQVDSVAFSVGELRRLAQVDRDDEVVYAAGLLRFLGDVAEVERRTGTRVLCGGAAGEGSEAEGSWT